MSPLSREELEKLTQKLRDQQKALLEEVRDKFDQRDNQHLGDLMRHEPGDSGDFSMADALADLNILRADRQIDQLRDIDAAFDRMKKGEYGVCVDCGTDLPLARLQAYPTAKRCLECQGRHELLYAQKGRPGL